MVQTKQEGSMVKLLMAERDRQGRLGRGGRGLRGGRPGQGGSSDGRWVDILSGVGKMRNKGRRESQR